MTLGWADLQYDHRDPKVAYAPHDLWRRLRRQSVVTDPHDVILDRFPNRHFGFGAGPHRCVGSHLGKLGARIGLEEFLVAFSDFAVTGYYALRRNGGEGRGLVTAPMSATRR